MRFLQGILPLIILLLSYSNSFSLAPKSQSFSLMQTVTSPHTSTWIRFLSERPQVVRLSQVGLCRDEVFKKFEDLTNTWVEYAGKNQDIPFCRELLKLKRELAEDFRKDRNASEMPLETHYTSYYVLAMLELVGKEAENPKNRPVLEKMVSYAHSRGIFLFFDLENPLPLKDWLEAIQKFVEYRRLNVNPRSYEKKIFNKAFSYTKMKTEETLRFLDFFHVDRLAYIGQSFLEEIVKEAPPVEELIEKSRLSGRMESQIRELLAARLKACVHEYFSGNFLPTLDLARSLVPSFSEFPEELSGTLVKELRISFIGEMSVLLYNLKNPDFNKPVKSLLTDLCFEEGLIARFPTPEEMKRSFDLAMQSSEGVSGSHAKYRIYENIRRQFEETYSSKDERRVQGRVQVFFGRLMRAYYDPVLAKAEDPSVQPKKVTSRESAMEVKDSPVQIQMLLSSGTKTWVRFLESKEGSVKFSPEKDYFSEPDKNFSRLAEVLIGYAKSHLQNGLSAALLKRHKELSREIHEEKVRTDPEKQYYVMEILSVLEDSFSKPGDRVSMKAMLPYLKEQGIHLFFDETIPLETDDLIKAVQSYLDFKRVTIYAPAYRKKDFDRAFSRRNLSSTEKITFLDSLRFDRLAYINKNILEGFLAQSSDLEPLMRSLSFDEKTQIRELLSKILKEAVREYFSGIEEDPIRFARSRIPEVKAFPQSLSHALIQKIRLAFISELGDFYSALHHPDYEQPFEQFVRNFYLDGGKLKELPSPEKVDEELSEVLKDALGQEKELGGFYGIKKVFDNEKQKKLGAIQDIFNEEYGVPGRSRVSIFCNRMIEVYYESQLEHFDEAFQSAGEDLTRLGSSKKRGANPPPWAMKRTRTQPKNSPIIPLTLRANQILSAAA